MNLSGEGPSEKRIALRSFARLGACPEEDWSGITDPKTRRRLQNRLNQRARRSQNKKPLNHSGDGDISQRNATSREEHGPPTLAITPRNNDQQMAAPTAIDITPLAEIDDVHILECGSRETRIIMARLEETALQYYTTGSPRSDLLLNLFQFNFTRALMENIRVLGLRPDQLHDDAISPFNTAGPWQDDSLNTLPIHLRPTLIQRSIPHHPWLDLLPVSEMRDNLILAGEFEEEAQLCRDMKGSQSTRLERSGIIVWSDPWDPAGWEVTEPFARSWGWVIKGCHSLARSTNRWRAERGERPLFRMN